MKIKSLCFIVIGLVFQVHGQTVSINTEHTTEELVNGFFGGISYELRNINGSSNTSIGYFENNGSNFPIPSGIVLRSGTITHTEGQYTGANISSVGSGTGDVDLQRIANDLGQQTQILDVSFLAFDFISVSNKIDFDFVFASNEYGEWQCAANDIFALFLTDLETNETINLGVLPNSETPISVKTIRDAAYNTSCISVNANLFQSYNVVDVDSSAINMRGQTKLLNSYTSIKPNKWYRIKIAIGDNKDSNFDSAIFVANKPKASFNLGADSVICQGGSRILNTGFDSTLYTHIWRLDGVGIPGETSTVLTAVQSGVYTVSVIEKTSNFEFEGKVTINTLVIVPPNDIVVDNSANNASIVFNLTINNHAALGLDSDEYDIFYYNSNENVSTNTFISNDLVEEYPSAGNENIYIRVKNIITNEYCDNSTNFKLLISDFNALNQAEDIVVCGESVTTVNLETVLSKVFENVNRNEFEVVFFESENDATLDVNSIQKPNQYTIVSEQPIIPIWIKVIYKVGGSYILLPFNITIIPLPELDVLEDVIQCLPGFVLPPIENGDYYDIKGIKLFEGDVITTSGLYYTMNESEEGCRKYASFEVTFIDDFLIELDHCGVFIIPDIEYGDFYSIPNGPSDLSKILTPGSEITQSQAIYFYAETEGTFCIDRMFSLNIIPIPPVDDPDDVVRCYNYTLPPLKNGSYYTGSAKTGILVPPGTNITESILLFVYNEENGCSDERNFRVDIFKETFENVDVCENYTLPPLALGKYYAEALGQGEEIPFGTVFRSETNEINKQIFVFVAVTSGENCTSNLSFNMRVKPLPPVDVLVDYLDCINSPLILEPLTNGAYFTAPNREGEPLFAGDLITKTQTIYINNTVDCSNESSFSVTIRPIPEIDNFTDVYQCTSFILPSLEWGEYYTQSGKKGDQLFPGDSIDESQEIFIYNGGYADVRNCSKESVFTVSILATKLDPVENLLVCDSYVLPPLSVGEYFTENGGKGQKLQANDSITSTQFIYIYHKNNDRFFCVSEASFKVTVSKTPVLQVYKNVEKCGRYTLPELESNEYVIGYFKSKGGKDPILQKNYNYNTPGVYTVYVFAHASDNKNCFDEKSFEITVYPLLELTIEQGVLCVNEETGALVYPALLETGLSNDDYLVLWFFKEELVGEGASYLAEKTGEYRIETYRYAPEIGADCRYKDAFVRVEKSSKAQAKLKIDSVFKNNATVTVDVYAGLGNYEFQLDDGVLQSNTIFYNVEYGAHTISIYDVFGCETIILDFIVLNYPRFFSPNGDGINDFWNILDLSEQQGQLYIYNRYGNLIHQLYTNELGWDGSFKNKIMPSDDYWFKVIFNLDGEQKVHRAHFSLKR